MTWDSEAAQWKPKKSKAKSSKRARVKSATTSSSTTSPSLSEIMEQEDDKQQDLQEMSISDKASDAGSRAREMSVDVVDGVARDAEIALCAKYKQPRQSAVGLSTTCQVCCSGASLSSLCCAYCSTGATHLSCAQPPYASVPDTWACKACRDEATRLHPQQLQTMLDAARARTAQSHAPQRKKDKQEADSTSLLDQQSEQTHVLEQLRMPSPGDSEDDTDLEILPRRLEFVATDKTSGVDNATPQEAHDKASEAAKDSGDEEHTAHGAEAENVDTEHDELMVLLLSMGYDYECVVAALAAHRATGKQLCRGNVEQLVPLLLEAAQSREAERARARVAKEASSSQTRSKLSVSKEKQRAPARPRSLLKISARTRSRRRKRCRKKRRQSKNREASSSSDEDEDEDEEDDNDSIEPESEQKQRDA